MNLMISEVQISCIILMGLITLSLSFVLPSYIKVRKYYFTALRLLLGSTTLIFFHFIIQYILHKNVSNVVEIRTVVNLLFGVPASYLAAMSYLYLQKKSKIRKSEWLFAPMLYLLLISVCILSYILHISWLTSSSANQIMAVIYASTLIYYAVLNVKEHFKILRDIRLKRDFSQIPLLKSMKWSLFVMALVAMGFPIMTFNTNLLMRSIYGILSISSFFFYILSFVIYGLGGNLNFTNTSDVLVSTDMDCRERNSDSKNDETIDRIHQSAYLPESKSFALSAIKQDYMDKVVKTFVDSGIYTKTGITIRDAADSMGISSNMLKVWLQSTPYEKFTNWITVLRINKSKELMMTDSGINIEEIAEKCGFCDRAYFSRLFCKQEGVTPAKWIKERYSNHHLKTQNEN